MHPWIDNLHCTIKKQEKDSFSRFPSFELALDAGLLFLILVVVSTLHVLAAIGSTFFVLCV